MCVFVCVCVDYSVFVITLVGISSEYSEEQAAGFFQMSVAIYRSL